MEVETVKMSSKGQIVIPQNIRDGLGASEGTVFAVLGTRDTVVLKRINKPSKEVLIRELEIIAREGRKRAEKLGIKENDFK